MGELRIGANWFTLPLDALVGESAAVLGIKGSGKTNTAAVIIEELLGSNFPLCIVDIEGEYWGLKERFEILVVGRSAHVDVEMDAGHAGDLARLSLQRGISVILDVSDFSQEEMFDFLLAYFKALWEAAGSERRPYQVILEEAHEFIPQSVRTPLKEILTRIALRGRKRGLGLISVSQRSAKVDKDVLTQAALVFLHRVVHPVDVKVYQDIVPLPAKEVEQMVRSLDKGQAIVLRQHETAIVPIRLRDTFHAGATPDFEAAAEPELRKIDDAMMTELRDILKKPVVESGDEHTLAALRNQLAAQEEIIYEKDALIATLQERIEILSKLEVQMQAAGIPIQMSLAEAMPEKSQPETASSLTEITKIIPSGYRTDLAITRATNRQERQFQRLLDAIHGIRNMKRGIEVLSFLHQNKDFAYYIPNVMFKLGYSISTKFSPGSWQELGLISNGGGRGYYRSRMAEELKQRFPDLDTEELIDQILSLGK